MVSKQRLEEVADYVEKHDVVAASEHFDIAVSTVRRYMSLYRESFPTVRVKDDNSEAVVTTQELLTVDEVREFGELSESEWKPHRVEYNRRADGKVQFKSTFVHQGPAFSLEEYVAQFEEHVKGIRTPRFKFKRRKDTGRLGTISVADWHHGKLVWGDEISGDGENWDIKISRKEFAKYFAYATNVLKQSKVDTIVVEVLGDFFNVDTAANTTTAGTQQAEDNRYLKTQAYAEEMLVDAVEVCRGVANNVIVLIVPGNHDMTRSLLLGSYLSAYFRNDKNVTVDADATSRKRILWGNTLLAYSHELKGEAVQNMYALWPEECAACTNLIYNTGHFHTRKDMIPVITYKQAVKLVQHPTMVPSDAWSDYHGYRHMREGLIRVFDKEMGPVCEYAYQPHFMEEV